MPVVLLPLSLSLQQVVFSEIINFCFITVFLCEYIDLHSVVLLMLFITHDQVTKKAHYRKVEEDTEIQLLLVPFRFFKLHFSVAVV